MLKIKLILIWILFFYTISCGVKAPPKPPEEKVFLNHEIHERHEKDEVNTLAK